MTENNLTDLEQVILSVLDPQKWIDRKQLASQLGRPKYVSSHDIKMLKRLNNRGLIETRKAVTRTVRYSWQYRLTEAGETAKTEYTGE